MKKLQYEGVYVALVPQRGSALLELLRQAARQFLGDKDLKSWSVEFGHLATPSGAVVFRLNNPNEPFNWRDGGYAQLARVVSELGPGRCWAMAVERAPRTGDAEGWAEGVAFDRGERVAIEESAGAEGAADLRAWFGEQLALSENEVLALFESCDQRAGVVAGEEKSEDEIDQILGRARREFDRYKQLKAERERQQS
jgi:hypothetical protein